jgi:hypothetical protein
MVAMAFVYMSVGLGGVRGWAYGEENQAIAVEGNVALAVGCKA